MARTTRAAATPAAAMPERDAPADGPRIAVIVCTLASPLSGFVTGANYRVDGGQIRSLN